MYMAINLGTAIIYVTLAWLLWWQAMPTLLKHRTRVQAYGVWLVGVAMILFANGHLDLWMANARPQWTFVAGDAFLIGAGITELLRARRMGPHKWTECPNGECAS